MSALMQQASARTFTHNLKNLSAILRKAQKDAKARGIDEAVLMEARLAPDMLPLKAQVMIACDIAKGGCGRVTGNEMPVYADDNASFAELQDRIKKTLVYMRGIKAAEYAGSDSREVEAQNPMGVLEFSGADFLFGWALPNFYFHCATAYNILRHNGLDIGKSDWLGKVPGMTARGPIVKAFGLKTKKKAKAKKPANKPARRSAAKAAEKPASRTTKKPAKKKPAARR